MTKTRLTKIKWTTTKMRRIRSSRQISCKILTSATCTLKCKRRPTKSTMSLSATTRSLAPMRRKTPKLSKKMRSQSTNPKIKIKSKPKIAKISPSTKKLSSKRSLQRRIKRSLPSTLNTRNPTALKALSQMPRKGWPTKMASKSSGTPPRRKIRTKKRSSSTQQKSSCLINTTIIKHSIKEWTTASCKRNLRLTRPTTYSSNNTMRFCPTRSNLTTRLKTLRR